MTCPDLTPVELHPFKKLIAGGLRSTMIAHLYIPALDSTANQASTLSKPIVTGLLRDKLGFQGLVFTDALNMKGVTKYYKPGILDLKALQAGNDVLLFPKDVTAGVAAIKTALENKEIKPKVLEKKVKKILSAKYKAGLHAYKPINTDNLLGYLSRPDADLVKRTLFQEAITVVKNEDKVIPVKVLDTTYFASLTIGAKGNNNIFQEKLSKYTSFSHFSASNDKRNSEHYSKLIKKLEHFSLVVVGIHNMNNSRSKGYGIRGADVKFLESLQKKTKVIVVVFGNPYSVEHLQAINNLMCAYQDQVMTQELAPQIIFGALGARGRLPVSAGKLPAGTGTVTKPLGRLGYNIPESAGMDSKVLARIDKIAAWKPFLKKLLRVVRC